MAYVYLVVAIFAEMIGTTALKSAEGFTKLGPSLITVAGYGVAFFLLSLTLKTIPVGMAYAMWSGVGIVGIAILAWIVHHQKPDLAAIIGMGLIVAGVVVMNLFSKTGAH